MALSVSRRRHLRRLRGSVTNLARVRLRTVMTREQQYTVHGVPLVLPPEHNLPFYQWRDPSYDTYATEVVSAIAARCSHVSVIDLGANVGDTAVAMLACGDNVSVVAVEGSARFAAYLRRNVERFGSRVRVVEDFVGPIGDATEYLEENGTGRLVSGATGAPVSRWVHPADLLGAADGPGDSRVVVWKSDIDGLDIPLLVAHWELIDAGCDVLWFEFDPASLPDGSEDAHRLAALLARSGRTLRIYDNLGRPMVTLAGDAVEQGVRDLTDWLLRQRAGHLTTPYLDVWAFGRDLGDIASVEHATR